MENQLQFTLRNIGGNGRVVFSYVFVFLCVFGLQLFDIGVWCDVNVYLVLSEINT